MTLREMRHAKALSLAQVQAATGINKGALSRMERGIYAPTPTQLIQLSRVYGVHPAGWHAAIQYVYEGGHAEAA